MQTNTEPKSIKRELVFNKWRVHLRGRPWWDCYSPTMRMSDCNVFVPGRDNPLPHKDSKKHLWYPRLTSLYVRTFSKHCLLKCLPPAAVGTSQIKLQILKLETVQIWCLWVDLCPVKSIISFWSISFKNWRHLYLLSHFRIERLIRRLRENPDQNKATEFKSKAWREASLWEVMLLGVPFQTHLKQTNKQTKYSALTNILFNKVFPH